MIRQKLGFFLLVPTGYTDFITPIDVAKTYYIPLNLPNAVKY